MTMTPESLAALRSLMEAAAAEPDYIDAQQRYHFALQDAAPALLAAARQSGGEGG